jgi:hypothetical protein
MVFIKLGFSQSKNRIDECWIQVFFIFFNMTDVTQDILEKKLYSTHRTLQLQAFRVLLSNITTKGNTPAWKLFRQLIVDADAPALPRTAAFHALPTLVQRGIYAWADAQEDLTRAASVLRFSSEEEEISSKHVNNMVDAACVIDVHVRLARLIAERESTNMKPRDATLDHHEKAGKGFSLPYTARKHPLVLLLDKNIQLISLLLDAIETTMMDMLNHCTEESHALIYFLHCIRSPLLHAMTSAEDASARTQTYHTLIRIARQCSHKAEVVREISDFLLDTWQVNLSAATDDLSIIGVGQAMLDMLLSSLEVSTVQTTALTRLALVCWSAVLDGVAADQPTRPWLSMLVRLHQTSSIFTNSGYVALAVSSCAWLLFTATTPLDIAKSMDILQGLIHHTQERLQRLTTLAALPLLQLVSDAGDRQLRTRATDLFTVLEKRFEYINMDMDVTFAREVSVDE